MTGAERQRLAAILGMLGSNSAGERDAAALAAEEFRKQHRMTWKEVLSLTAIEPHFEAPSPHYKASHYETPHYETRWHKAIMTTFRVIAMLAIGFSL